MIERTELLYERAYLRNDGGQKKRTRPLAGLSGLERRDLYSRLERRFRDAVRTVRKALPARAERRTQSLNRRRGGSFSVPGFRIPIRRPLIQAPRRAGGGIGILRNR